VASTAVVVLVIAHHLGDPLSMAFERAARDVLGQDAEIELVAVDSDPGDEDSVARAASADGVVELSWQEDGSRARIHCWVTRDARWIDREIVFNRGEALSERDAAEQGRLLGFAAATMFSNERAPEHVRRDQAPSFGARAAPPSVTDERPREADGEGRAAPPRSLEFAGIFSSGVEGDAGGIGAMAGLRLHLSGPLFVRGFVAGRAGNLPKAQATTRTAMVGAGAAFSALPSSSRWGLGVRADAFVGYFSASHLSEDDVAPDQRSRWLPGGDILAEAGYRFAGGAGVFTGAGVESVLGRTDVYTHGSRVAVVPVIRLVGELGFRTEF
jgi:hypothetical protein